MRLYFNLLVIVFLLMCGACFYFHELSPAYKLPITIGGNVLLALLSLVCYALISKSLKNNNPNALIRAKTAGMMLKFFVSIAALLIYIFVNNRIVHKPTIFMFLAMYVIYSFIEAITLSRMAKS